jgi:hypothetical protein
MNRVYLGELRAGRHVARSTHPALVNAGTWQRAQRPRTTTVRNEKTPTLLGGLLRCAGCRMVLHSQTITAPNGRRIAQYSCHARSSQGVCAASAYVTGPVVEPYVEEVFFGEVFARERRRSGGSSLSALRRQLRQTEKALDQYRDSPRILKVLGEDRFVKGLEVRTRAQDRVMQALAAEERRVADVEMPSGTELENQWPSLTVQERRSAIHSLLDCVFVERGWGHAADRTFICFRGEEPPDLPRRGSGRLQGVPLDSRQMKRRRPHRPARWTKGRIRAKLAAFLADRPDWPPSEEFTRSGNGPVYAQVVRTGGPERWALLMGVRQPNRKQGIRAWDRDLAERTLRGFVRHRRSFPTRREFAGSGFRGLYNWLQKHGGMNYWAAEIGLPRVRRSLEGEKAVRRRWSSRDRIRNRGGLSR